MDLKSPYLDAIQHIPGNTAKEKCESLNKIIKQIIESKRAPGDFASKTLNGSPIPEVLTPLIETEIAKISKNTDDLIAALKSDDANIVYRALQADWVFDGSNKEITNFRYFATNVFPEVSLNTRTNIIKRLSQHLGHKNAYTVAQEFFEGITKTYGLKQAMPLLPACSGNYISEFIKDGNVCLPKKIVTRLFSKYPELVIKYLKFGKPNSRKERVVDSISIIDYLDLLPKLIKKHVHDFIDIVGSFKQPLNIKLGNKCAEIFLKSKGVEAVVEFPQKYLPILSLKLVTRKLSKEQFELMFRNLFPKNQKDFFFNKILTYLEFQPEEMKLPLITKTFRDLYGIDLITVLDKVTPKLLLMLSNEDRVNVAQKKLALDSDMKLYDCEESWTCYLSTAESIPRIKDHISKLKEMEDRAALVGQLIYTCKVNKSVDDLLRVLQYISTRHRNEIPIFWFRLYESLMKNFDLPLLSADHWTVLSEMIQRSYVKDYFLDRPSISENLLEKAVHYNLLNSIPIKDRMTMLAELKIKGWNSKFNILCDYPDYEKQCLETFIDIIPRKFPEDNSIWEDNRLDTIQNLTKGLYDYNERIMKAANKNQKNLRNEGKLSVTNYPWLLESLKNIVLKEGTQRHHYKIDNLKTLLQNHERKLYDSWFPPKETIARVFKQEGLNLLKKEPGKVLEHWKDYLESCEKNIHYVHTRRFLKKCTWYQDIPVKFLQETLRKVDKCDSSTIMILALLLRGPEFTRIIEPLIPVSDKMEIDGEDARDSYRGTSSVPSAINQVNPPPPLELVGKFCQGDYLSLGLASLMNVARRVPVRKVIAFAKSLVDKSVSIKKHGIRLMCVVASTTDLCKFLGHLWNTEKHKSIREVIFQKAHCLFTNKPCQETWLLMSYSIESLIAEDVECFNVLKELRNVSNEYVKDYFETALNKIEKLAKDGLNPSITSQLISSLLKKVDAKVCASFPEDYCQLLLRKFTFDLNKDEEILTVGRSYAVNVFLLEADEKLELRLRYFCDVLIIVIKHQWDLPHPKNFRFYPMKQLFSEIVRDIVIAEKMIKIDPMILKAMIELFSTVLKPNQDPDSYLSLYFAIEFRKAEFDGRVFGLQIGKKLPETLNFFSPEMIIDIASTLSDFMLPVMNRKLKEGTLIGSLTQALTESKSIHSSILAAILIYKNHILIPDDLFKEIVQKLRKVNHPTIESFLNKQAVCSSLNEVYCLNV